MRTRIVRIGLVAMTLLSAAVATAGNAARPIGTPVTGAITITGPAGGEMTIRLANDLYLDYGRQWKEPLRSSRAGFAGVVVTSASGGDYVTVASGVSGPSCAFATSCESSDFPAIDGSGYDTRFNSYYLPAGTYTVGLAGPPGSTVTATLAFGSGRVTKVLHTNRFGHLRVGALTSTDPATADEAPMTDAATTFNGTSGLTFVGSVIRWDVNVPKEMDYSTCVGAGDGAVMPAMAIAGSTVCQGNSVSGSGQVQVYQCAPVPAVCLPVATTPQVATISNTTVRRTARPQFAVSTSTKAFQSRVAVTIFTLTV